MKNAGQRLVPIRPMCGSWWGEIVTPTDWVLLVCTCIGFVGATTSCLRAYHLRPGRKKTQPAFISLPRLPAGPELDRRIAEDFMGLIPCDQWEGPYPQEGGLTWDHTGPMQHQCYRRGDPPPYSQSWGHAWEVLEELRRRKRRVVFTLDGRRSRARTTVIIDDFPPIEADTVIHAISLAALHTVRQPPPIPKEA